MLQNSERYFVILCRKDRMKGNSKFKKKLKFHLDVWKKLHKNWITEKKLKKNEFQWMMCQPHFLALSWSDTKIVNYLTNYHSPSEFQQQCKRERGKSTKITRLIPSKLLLNLF